ncbi:hypothetical protein FisN_11Lh116 [Fistulifera solaris]|uniref:RPAP1 N-terminal domain-containing protein n=1 Tax=Fistulifera solaris TaxID=1519565 RepID=A0A1Z5J7H4_FISSO|nr:hypothetical protein FisN_11Lh116 [Fistulifera solaris]|eukprot:GAX09899.1 hypothetical protein FisN_11Lh116 [Fistulifera solaris]
MANTEGQLTDEALQCLLGGDEFITTKGLSALQRRMDMPMGDKPAAKVTRSSGQSSQINNPSRQNTNETAIRAPSDETLPPPPPPPPPPPLIGNIVEKKRSDRTNRPSSTSSRKPSRFAMQSKSGFPSLQAPLGSFVQKKNKSISNTTTWTSSMSKTDETASETDRIMAQMSPEEIQESIQELHQVLSPETIQFLKTRRKSKETRSIASVAPPTGNNLQAEPTLSADEALIEKERVANLLASVRNYDDMDTLYRQEMGTELFVEEGKSEFQTACELLRSSVPRQNLWAVRHLENVLREATDVYCLGTENANKWPYPTLLPVSLRCLLDVSPSTVVGAQIQIYALGSLFYLTSMRVPVDYVLYDVATGDLRPTAAHLYSEYFLDDAVPSSTYKYATTNSMQPLSVSESTVAYATSSSTTSAQDDGEAFLRDPLWTLLSRMRIIPWLANWLRVDVSSTNSVRAVIGLLVLLVQRSPGAATAVVQHPTLLTNLMTKDAGSTIILQCVAARQSRATACHLAKSDQIIQDLVSFSETTEPSASDPKRCKWTMVLWRTLLRYGLALDALPTVLKLAARHVTLGSDLSCYFFSAFSTLTNCIIAANKSPTKNEPIVSNDNRALLANAAAWLSASRCQALRHLESAEDNWFKRITFNDSTFLEKTKFYASVFRFLASWTRMCESFASDRRDGDFKAEDLTESEEKLWINVVLKCLEYDSMRELMRRSLTGMTDLSSRCTVHDLSIESASCSFTESLLELLSTLTRYNDNTPDTVSSLRSIHDHIREIRHQESGKVISSRLLGHSSIQDGRSRQYWLNRVHSSYLKFVSLRGWELSDDKRADVTVSLIDVIGRLDNGEESIAAILFSCDNLLRPTSQDSNSPSIISSWFVRCLCATPTRRAQLDHSFKLRGGSGISADKCGPFELQTLLSISTSVVSATDNLLPLGSNWLWKTLAGSVLDNDAAGEALLVLTSTLGLSCELEVLDMFQKSSLGSAKSAGGRMYYVMNLLLKSEDILADERIQILAVNFMDLLYKGCIDVNFIVGFAEECESHNSIKDQSGEKLELGEDSSEFQQLSKLIDPPVGREEIFTKSQIHSLQSFVYDICDSFVEYGAQFEFGRKCMNFFFSAYFPSKTKCEIIQRLRGTLHLITVENEKVLDGYLRRCLLGGVPCRDGSDRDTPDILDAAASILSQKDTVFHQSNFVTKWAIALLLRDVTGCFLAGENLLSCRRRVLALRKDCAHALLASVDTLAKAHGEVDDIIIVSTALQMENTINGFDSVEAHWEHMLEVRHIF